MQPELSFQPHIGVGLAGVVYDGEFEVHLGPWLPLKCL